MIKGVSLRDVSAGDLHIFFEQQADPVANRMAAFPARDKAAFTAHWEKILANSAGITRAIIFRGGVAGNIVSWDQGADRQLGYWLGKEYWGKGIASTAVKQFLDHDTVRPLKAHVARGNVASVRVLQKCGFVITSETTFHDPDWLEGEELILTLEANQARQSLVP